DEAAALYARAIAIQRATGQERRGAAPLSSISTLHQDKGSYREAQETFDEKLPLLRRIPWPRPPAGANRTRHPRGLFTEIGDYAAAERQQREALAIRLETLGDNHPDTWQSTNNLAVVLWNEGRYAEAEPLFRQALAHRRQAYGNVHPLVASNAGNLGMLLV